jgi:hypothetical protein
MLRPFAVLALVVLTSVAAAQDRIVLNRGEVLSALSLLSL